MKVGIIGTRHVHAGGLAQNVVALGGELVGAVERDESARTAWDAGLAPLRGLDETLADADAVIVAGTNRERVDDVLAAVEAGVPVLGEKPVAVNRTALDALVAGTGPDTRFMVALPVRFGASLQRAKAAIEAGAIGTPIAGRGTNHGVFPGGWFGDPAEAGGGALQDHVVHLSDAMCWLLGDRVSRVYARAESAMGLGIAVEDCGVVTLDFESGFFASIDSSWSRPKSFPTWGDVWLELVGTEGRIVIDPMATRLELYDDAAGKLRHVGYSDDDMTRAMVGAFMEYARSGEAAGSPVSLAEGVHASEVVLAAYASVESGRPEPVEALLPAPA